MSQAVLACRGCLATDTKLFDYNENKLKESFMELIGSPFQEMESARMPQYLCSYCNALLIKCIMFRDRCLRAQSVLELIDECDLTTAYIASVDRGHYSLNLNLSISNPVIIDSDSTEEEMPIETLEDIPEEFAYEEYLEDEVKLEDDYDALEKADFEYDDMATVNDDDMATLNDDAISPGERKNKFFSVHDFENRHNVTIDVLSKEQQILEVYERKEASKKSQFGCNDCGKTFLNADKLRNHFMMSHDPNIGHFMCELCNNRYENRSKLRRHIFCHKYRFNCNDCPFNTMRLSSAKNHYFRHQGVQFCCDKCGKSFSMNTSYLSHLRKHHPSKYSWCRYCGESFLGDIGLRNHKKMIHYDVINSKHICQTCEMPFVSDEALQIHNGTSCSEHSCFECGSSFEDKQYLRCHLISHHKRPSRSKSFKCGVCDIVFENAKSLNYHFEFSKSQCYGLRFCVKCGVQCATEAEVVEHMANMHEDKKFECVKCQRTFPNTYKLNLHNKQAHKRLKGETRRLVGTRQWRVLNTAGGDVIAGEGGFMKQEQRGEKNVCEFCGKPCPNIIALKIHRRVHTGERPYKCPICVKRFTTELLCTQHIRVHTGERPYKCLYCPKTFKSKPAVNRHILIHTDERKHICTLCNKAFRTSTDVKTHIKYVHMKVPPQPRERKARIPKDERKHICMICNEAYLTSAEAKLHVKQAHMTAPPLPVVDSRVD